MTDNKTLVSLPKENLLKTENIQAIEEIVKQAGQRKYLRAVYSPLTDEILGFFTNDADALPANKRLESGIVIKAVYHTRDILKRYETLKQKQSKS